VHGLPDGDRRVVCDGLAMSYFLVLCRAIVGCTFVLSAYWKLRHRTVFDAVVAGAARAPIARSHPKPLRRVLAPAVATLEFVVAGALFLLPIAWIPALAAVLFLIIFSGFLLRAGTLANGCGCWRPPQSGHSDASPYLIRNGLLIGLAAAGAVSSQALAPAPRIALIAAGLLPALLIMEIPAVAELLRPARRPAIGGRSTP
jgi:uncharacterized membrane protein YphA (DoxX/SURF4 family)